LVESNSSDQRNWSRATFAFFPLFLPCFAFVRTKRLNITTNRADEKALAMNGRMVCKAQEVEQAPEVTIEDV
jgi:hypothetical protein